MAIRREKIIQTHNHTSKFLKIREKSSKCWKNVHKWTIDAYEYWKIRLDRIYIIYKVLHEAILACWEQRKLIEPEQDKAEEGKYRKKKRRKAL